VRECRATNTLRRVTAQAPREARLRRRIQGHELALREILQDLEATQPSHEGRERRGGRERGGEESLKFKLRHYITSA